jgi:hypothetical protein
MGRRRGRYARESVDFKFLRHVNADAMAAGALVCFAIYRFDVALIVDWHATGGRCWKGGRRWLVVGVWYNIHTYIHTLGHYVRCVHSR